MEVLKRIILILLIIGGGSAVPSPLGELVAQREAFAGDSFRDARQTPIFNDLETTNFVLPPEFKDPTSGQSETRGNLVDSSLDHTNDNPLLVGFTPNADVGPSVPSLSIGVNIPSEPKSASENGQQDINRVGVALPGSGVDVGVDLPHSIHDGRLDLRDFGIQVSSENGGRTQFNLDRNANSIIGVAINSDHNPSEINLDSLISQSQGVPLPSATPGNIPSFRSGDPHELLSQFASIGVPIPPQSNSGHTNAQFFPEIPPQNSNRGNVGQEFIGVPLPPIKGAPIDGNLNRQFSSARSNQNFDGLQFASIGVPLPPNNDGNLQISRGTPLNPTEINQVFNSGVPLPNSDVTFLQPTRNQNFDPNSQIGVPIPSIVESGGDLSGSPNGQTNRGSLNTEGASLISSQGQNTIRTFPVEHDFPLLPEPTGSLSAFDNTQPSVPSDLGGVGVPLPSETDTLLSNDNTLGSFLSTIASQPGPIDLSNALTENKEKLEGIENLTIGDLLMGINGHNGIMVVPMSSVSGEGEGRPSLPELKDLLSENNIGKSVQDSTSSTSNLQAVEAQPKERQISIDLSASPSDTSPVTPPPVTTSTTRRPRRRRPTTTRPPQVLRDILSDLLFSKGQWFGTLIGGMIDYGIILRDSFRENFRSGNVQQKNS